MPSPKHKVSILVSYILLDEEGRLIESEIVKVEEVPRKMKERERSEFVEMSAKHGAEQLAKKIAARHGTTHSNG